MPTWLNEMMETIQGLTKQIQQREGRKKAQAETKTELNNSIAQLESSGESLTSRMGHTDDRISGM